MKKINLIKLYSDSMAERIAAMRAKATIFVETDAIPLRISAAKNCDFALSVHVPDGLAIECVAELIAEQVEYKTVTKEGRCLKYFWG